MSRFRSILFRSHQTGRSNEAPGSTRVSPRSARPTLRSRFSTHRWQKREREALCVLQRWFASTGPSHTSQRTRVSALDTRGIMSRAFPGKFSTGRRSISENIFPAQLSQMRRDQHEIFRAVFVETSFEDQTGKYQTLRNRLQVAADTAGISLVRKRGEGNIGNEDDVTQASAPRELRSVVNRSSTVARTVPAISSSHQPSTPHTPTRTSFGFNLRHFMMDQGHAQTVTPPSSGPATRPSARRSHFFYNVNHDVSLSPSQLSRGPRSVYDVERMPTIAPEVAGMVDAERYENLWKGKLAFRFYNIK